MARRRRPCCAGLTRAVELLSAHVGILLLAVALGRVDSPVTASVTLRCSLGWSARACEVVRRRLTSPRPA